MNCNYSKSVISKLYQDKHILLSKVTALQIGMHTTGLSTYQKPFALKHQIYDYLRRVGKLESWNCFQLSPLRHLNTYFTNDRNAVLRRSLPPKHISPFNFPVAKDKVFEMAYECSCITTQLNCFLNIPSTFP